MEELDRTSPLYLTALRLISRVAATRETLTHLTHLAAAEGRVDLALSLRAVSDSLDGSEMEAVAVLRRLDGRSKSRPDDGVRSL